MVGPPTVGNSTRAANAYLMDPSQEIAITALLPFSTPPRARTRTTAQPLFADMRATPLKPFHHPYLQFSRSDPIQIRMLRRTLSLRGRHLPQTTA